MPLSHLLTHDSMIKINSLSFLDKATLVLAVALLLCLFPLPYGFYTIIRFAVSIIAGCWAYQFYKNNKIPLTIIAGAIVILFQPLIKIVLDRTTWNILDVILAILCIIMVWLPKKQSIQD